MSDRDVVMLQEWPALARVLMDHIGCDAWQPHNVYGNDHGVDAWFGCDAVDFKNNQCLYAGSLIVETWSVYNCPRTANVRGWTFDAEKKTDWIVQTFLDYTAALIPFEPFRLAATRYEVDWLYRFPERSTTKGNPDYETKFVWVPTSEIARSVAEFGGDVKLWQRTT